VTSYLRSARGLQLTLMLCVVANIVFNGCDEVALPDLAHAHFGARGFGIALAALAAGSLVGALAATRVRARRPAVTASVAFFVAAAAVSLVPLTLGLVNAAAWMAVLGGGISFGNVVIVTAVQRDVPPPLLGRVMGLVMLSSLGVAPLSVVVSGVVVGHVGPAPFFPAAGIGLALAMLVGLAAPSFRTMGATPPPEPAR
jgi:MFS family permease